MLLEALSQPSKAGAPLEELVGLSHLPKTTVHRLLYSMGKLGYVDKDPVTNLYALSGKFFELGPHASPYGRLTAIAKPLMRKLLMMFGESVNLAVPHLNMLIYILVLESQAEHRVAATVGSYSFLHCTAVGKSISAYLPKEERQSWLKNRGMPGMTSSTITSVKNLDKELAKVRSQGVAVDNEENNRGIICVGGPIFSNAPLPVAALSVSGPAHRMSGALPAIKSSVRETVQTISGLLTEGCC